MAPPRRNPVPYLNTSYGTCWGWTTPKAGVGSFTNGHSDGEEAPPHAVRNQCRPGCTAIPGGGSQAQQRAESTPLCKSTAAPSAGQVGEDIIRRCRAAAGPETLAAMSGIWRPAGPRISEGHIDAPTRGMNCASGTGERAVIGAHLNRSIYRIISVWSATPRFSHTFLSGRASDGAELPPQLSAAGPVPMSPRHLDTCHPKLILTTQLSSFGPTYRRRARLLIKGRNHSALLLAAE